MEKLPKIAKFLDVDLDRLDKGKRVNKKHLTNALNYVNFQDGVILLKFKHLKYDTVISLEVRPQPCLGDSLDCLWVETSGLVQNLKSYQFQHLLLTDGQRLLLVAPELKRISAEGISFTLPESCYELNSRKARRHLCEGIQVDFAQNSVIFYGTLLDFSAISFCVDVANMPPQSFQWINPESPVIISFRNEHCILYSGECRIVRQTLGQQTRIFALEPLTTHMRRFKPKVFRSSRQKLSPSPSIFFKHPITRKMISLEVEDMSGSGFSVEENRDNSVLLPCMIIPHLEIEIAVDFRIACKGQVVYRNPYSSDEDETCVKCGVTFLDMDIQDQLRLSAILYRLENRNSDVCCRIDLDDLWKFFVDSGFVSHGKYASMHAFRERFKWTYERLYIQNPHIARHLIYQDKGIIQCHIPMLRFYKHAWLFHYYASAETSFMSSVVLLHQMGRYIDDFHSLYPEQMKFIISYFMSDESSEKRILGGFAKYLNNPEGCSVDSFASFNFPISFETKDLSGTLLTESQPEDLSELASFYQHVSGGIMLRALDLGHDIPNSSDIDEEYQKIDIKKERHIFSLKKEGNYNGVCLRCRFELL